ncbi:MAG: DUF177 domain-containing protein [Melioribacteraceae bacterium]|nr:DUF177 domain-containing protein [Melioribacteraceae bacterium]
MTQFFQLLEMIIKYTNYSDGIHELNLSESTQKLGLDDSFFGNAEVKIKMDKSIHQIVLDCNLTIHSHVECDRCTEKVDKEFTNHFVLSYIFSKSNKSTDDFNFKYLSTESDKIDITEDVFEYSELSIPLKKLCKDDCKGLCPKCGKNLNYDNCTCQNETTNNVWEPLQILKEKLNNKK